MSPDESAPASETNRAQLTTAFAEACAVLGCREKWKIWDWDQGEVGDLRLGPRRNGRSGASIRER